MLKKIQRTRQIETDANVHNDGRRTHTNWNEFYSGPIRKYTQVNVGCCSSMCEGL